MLQNLSEKVEAVTVVELTEMDLEVVAAGKRDDDDDHRRKKPRPQPKRR
jgi:hypothetical protein